MGYSHSNHVTEANNNGQDDGSHDKGYHQPYKLEGWGITNNERSNEINEAYHSGFQNGQKNHK